MHLLVEKTTFYSMHNDLEYHVATPDPSLAAVVESFWQLNTTAPVEKPIWLLPDGRLDVLFACSATEPFHATLIGLGSEAERALLAPRTLICGVSLRLLAPEYLLRIRVADLLNQGRVLPAGFWGITAADLTDFSRFCEKVSAALRELLRPVTPDARKQRLCELLYATHGELPVQELATRAGWSSRQINRYFREYFGLSLKTYCAILRFRASFSHLKAGRLFPEQAFADQAHFIREVRRFAGVRPRELAQNKDDRFIQFSAWPAS